MNIQEIIAKKRDKQKLSKEEIDFFIKEYTNGNIADYQASALIMAIYINSMDEEETTNLTIAMAHSGDILDLSKIASTVVDKHSTGGVGDKVSLILLPLIASLEIPVAKMSGRGLGFTGGTVDKLKSIPGYETEISEEKFIENIQKIGISMISQTLNLAPADKKLYALRDSTATVESIPLIASSIMSKKIASGANKIVLDVTVGKGAFMKNIEQAEKLAKEMIEIGKLANRETVCVLTNMDEPLGYAVGNNLEVKEAIEFLKGNMPEDLKEVVFELGAYMMKLAGKGEDINNNKQLLLENIVNYKAYNKFLELVNNQNGDISYIENPEKFENVKYIEPVYAEKSGSIEEIDAKKIGELACFLGAGRLKKEDEIDDTVGIVLNKKVGDVVEKNEVLAYIHANDNIKLRNVLDELKRVIKISDKSVNKNRVVFSVILNCMKT